MQKSDKPRIPVDTEAWLPCLIFAAIAALGFIFDITWLWVLFIIPLIIFLYFFRDPPRHVPRIPGAVVSPADGKICAIRTNADPEAGPVGGQVITIFLSVLNVHINRAPYAGQVEDIRYKPGEFLNALDAASSDKNESNWIYLKCGRYPVTVRQIAGLIARRIVCRVHEGQHLRRGQRIGLIRFGSRTELYLPPEARIQAEVGQKVTGGLTVLAFLPEGD
jgi:phosphatidylserine decarboxylase